MASLMAASVTPLHQVGVFRVLTQEFLQHRKTVVKNYHSMSDSEEVRWVSVPDVSGNLSLKQDPVNNQLVCFLPTQHSGSDTIALVPTRNLGGHSQESVTAAPEW